MRHTSRVARRTFLKRPSRLGVILSAAAAAILAMPAAAQFRVGDDGQALDANNRLGSGGYNSRRLAPVQVTADQIISGNVTGGRAFRGNLSSGDPTAFRGNLGSDRLDRFIRDSAGVPQAGQQVNTPGSYSAYYARQSTAAPPAGYRLSPFTNSYVPDQRPQRGLMDIQLNASPQTRIADPSRPTELILSGPVNRATGSPVIIASPTYGIITADPASLGGTGANARADLRGLDPIALRQLSLQAKQNTLQGATSSLPNAANQPGQTGPGATPVSPTPAGTSPFGLQRTDPAAIAPAPGSPGSLVAPGSLGTGNSAIAPPAQTITPQAGPGAAPAGARTVNQQLQELRQKWNAAGPSAKPEADNTPGKTAAPAAPGANTPAAPGIGAPATPPTPAPAPAGLAPAGSAPAGSAPAPAPAPAVSPGSSIPLKAAPAGPKAKLAIDPATLRAAETAEGVKVESLAQGHEPGAMRDVLSQAEKLVQEGDYQQAIGRYELALAADPTDGTVLLGKSHALLASGKYVAAAESLRLAVETDPSVLLMQLSLSNVMGEPRLQAVVRDLKAIAVEEKESALPTLLLSYIAHQSGQGKRAVELLDESVKRSGSDANEFFTLLRARYSRGN